MAQTSALRKDPAPARDTKRAPLKSPWSRNSVRRRWAYGVFLVIILFAAILVFSNLSLGKPFSLQLPLTLLGFGALPLLYPVAKRLGASRSTALWAMALLGASVPWLVLLRACTPCATIPFFVILGVFCYTRVLARLPWSWVALGLALTALVLANPWAGLGLVLGLALHAAGWVRQPGQWRMLAFAGAILTLGAILLAVYPPVRDPAWSLPDGSQALGQFLGYLLMMNAWVLPLLALPLLWLALFTDPAHRWRVNADAALPALVIVATVIVASLSPSPMRLRILLGLAPLAALWLAMGLTRLQTRTPAWVWVPVSLMLVLTSLPQTLVRWGSQAIGLHHAIPDRTFSAQLAERRPAMLVPLYPLLTHDLAGETLDLRDI
jgi:hypothetical protein